MERMDLLAGQPVEGRWSVVDDLMNGMVIGLVTWPQSDGTMKSLVVLQY